jgi:acyl-CoA synthetase (AMP-forming)/AMP-acid ligase II
MLTALGRSCYPDRVTPENQDSHAAFESLMRACRERPDHVAVRAGARSYTYAELDAHARMHAAGLRALGLERGARVAVLAEPRVESIIALLAHYRAGLVQVPINTRYREAEVAHILLDSGAAAILTDAAGVEVLDAAAREHPALGHVQRIQLDGEALRPGDRSFAAVAAQAGPDDGPDDGPNDEPDHGPDEPHADADTALLIYTSGTTGRSKGVALSMSAVVGGIRSLTELWAWRPDDVLVLALPLFHVHGLGIGVHGGLLHGLTIELLPRFSAAAVIDAVERGGTIFMGVPTMYRMLLEHLDTRPADARVLARARLFTAGSAALPAADFERFAELTGHRILERYGMSETLLTLSNPADGERRPGSVGLPVPGFEVRIVDDDGQDCAPEVPGELAVRGVGLMTGYWNQPEATHAAFRDGWFMTGDVAARDPDGYVRILGRRSVDIIKSGGFKISAREIEEVIAEHPAVAEVAVLGLADPKWGQKIAAVVVAAPDHPLAGDPLGLLRELVQLTGARLADYKKPRALAVVTALPRNALGKIQKTQLVTALEQGAIPVIVDERGSDSPG